jgi:hypothetical protein
MTRHFLNAIANYNTPEVSGAYQFFAGREHHFAAAF